MRRQECGDLFLAFLALQRTDCKDQCSTGLDHRRARLQNLIGHRARMGDIAGLLDPGQVRMAADGTGGGTWRIHQHQRRGQLHLPRITLHDGGAKTRAGQILPDAPRPHRIDLHRCHQGPRRGKLHGLAARRRTQVDDAPSTHIAQQICRKRGGRVLHPPVPFREARHRLDPPASLQPPHPPEQPIALWKGCGIGFQDNIGRRLVQMRLGNPARRLPVVLLAPAAP
ncbi:MAG: hypothetical protein BGN85_07990 [Alphaproteobacteria bacterium 64-11]|nr:MAG: hypothetical protein BGN85_07990 [Alphaproteobacteria bacterium 64-11]